MHYDSMGVALVLFCAQREVRRHGFPSLPLPTEVVNTKVSLCSVSGDLKPKTGGGGCSSVDSYRRWGEISSGNKNDRPDRGAGHVPKGVYV